MLNWKYTTQKDNVTKEKGRDLDDLSIFFLLSYATWALSFLFLLFSSSLILSKMAPSNLWWKLPQEKIGSLLTLTFVQKQESWESERRKYQELGKLKNNKDKKIFLL